MPCNAALSKEAVKPSCEGLQPTRAHTKTTSHVKPSRSSTEEVANTKCKNSIVCYGLHITRRLRYLSEPVSVFLCVIFDIFTS